MDDDFGVAGGLEDGALLIQLRANFQCVSDVAVVGQGNFALIAFHQDGLGVEQRRIAGGGIARVSDGQRARQAAQRVCIEDVGDQPHGFVELQTLAVGRRNPRRLLPAMLQCIQAKVSELGGLGMAVDGYHATFFA